MGVFTRKENSINPSDLEIIKKENFDEKDFESALRWSLRGLKAEFCVKKTKIDIAKKKRINSQLLPLALTD